MTHPTYDKSDPKAGQPVLVGDEFYWRNKEHDRHPLCGPHRVVYVILGEVRDEVDAGWTSKEGFFFSAPPAPAIEACDCGGRAEVVPCSGGRQQVCCTACYRTGPSYRTRDAIASWNADMRALKAGNHQHELLCKGSMALGSGCGKCARCREEMANKP